MAGFRLGCLLPLVLISGGVSPSQESLVSSGTQVNLL